MISDNDNPCGCNVYMEGFAEDEQWLEDNWMDDEPVDLEPASNYRLLTDMSLNWIDSEVSPPNPNMIGGVTMASVICNQMRFANEIFFCSPPPAVPCVGMHISYNPANVRERQAVTQFLTVMNVCGMPATLVPAGKKCCKSGKKHFKVVIAAGAKPTAGMNRTATMIGSTTRGFCLDINTGLRRDVDLFTQSPNKEDSQFNPLNFDNEGYLGFKFSGTNIPYNRLPCDLLAHIVAENYYGNYQEKGKRGYLDKDIAHAMAIAEENWVRQERNAEGGPCGLRIKKPWRILTSIPT